MEQGTLLHNRYRIETLLGQGTLGRTYKALDTLTQQPVAVKVLHFSRLQEWKALELFEREAAILKKLRHPQIPAYIEYFSEETPQGIACVFVQEYIAGHTLQQRVESGWRGTEADIIEIIRQIVAILAYLHTLDPPVIHRDLNPRNLIVTPDNVIHLVDFGSVREAIRTTLFSGSTITGTFGYMPFEQFSGQAVPASDYYALGATLLYLLTHKQPSDFPSEGFRLQIQPYLQASPVMMQLVRGLLEPAAEQRIASPEQIDRILTRMSPPLNTQPADLPLPHGSMIQKVVTPSGEVQLVLPGKRENAQLGFSAAWLIGVTIWTLMASSSDNIFFVLWSIPFWLAGFGMAGSSVYKAFGKTVLELTPDLFIVQYLLFGKSYRRRFPIQSLRPIQSPSQPLESIRLQCGAHTVQVGAHLTPAEKEWLIHQMTAYTASTIPPLTETPAKPHGSKLAKTVVARDHLRYHLPRKLETSPFIALGFMVFWFGFLIFMQRDVGEFVWFSLIFWVMGVLTVLGSLAGMIRMFSRTTLDLTRDWIRKRSTLFGLGFSRKVKTASVRDVGIETQTTRNMQPFQQITFQSDAAPLRLGWQLSPAEQEWLLREIKEYLAKSK